MKRTKKRTTYNVKFTRIYDFTEEEVLARKEDGMTVKESAIALALDCAGEEMETFSGEPERFGSCKVTVKNKKNKGE